MRKIFFIIFIASIFCFDTYPAQGQSSTKGFNYSAHSKMNHKAGRWSKRRLKASGNDQVNLKCSVRKSRRYARHNK